MKELSIEEKAKRYDEAIIRGSRLWESDMITRENYEYIFPEVKESEESEDEKIRKWLIALIKSNEYGSISNVGKMPCPKLNVLTWLEKQGEQKYTNSYCQENCKGFKETGKCFADGDCKAKREAESIDKINPKFKIGDTIVEKDLDECGYGTIKDIKDGQYIFTDGSAMNINEQGGWQLVKTFTNIEQKSDDKVKPKFKVGDWVVWDNKISCHVDKIYQGKESLMYTITDTNNMTRSYSVKGFDNNAHLWTIQDTKDGDVLAAHECLVLFKEIDGLNIKCYCTYHNMGSNPSFYVDTLQNKTAFYPATKEQRDLLFQKMREAGYTFDFKKKELKKIESYNLRSIIKNEPSPAIKKVVDSLTKDEKIEQAYDVETQKSVEWEPQTGDTFRKKGTTSPTYHLCGKREDGITFGFVENREVGIAGGEITIFALKRDYELVERLKPIEDVVEEELNKALQTKVEQKPVKNKGTNLKEEEMTPFQKEVFYIIDTNIEAEVGLKQECDILLALASNEIEQKTTWSEEDKRILYNVKAYIGYAAGQRGVKDELFKEANEWLNSLPIGFIYNKNYNEDMVTLLIGELKQIANNNNAPEQYQAEINWLKSLRPQNNITDEELAQAKKNAYNDALDKIEYHSGELTFDDGWSAAIWYLKKRNAISQTTWKPTKEQLRELENVFSPNTDSWDEDILRKLYEQLKQL